MPGFTKLWSETITSSIWSEDDRTRIVWITMLAAVGPDGIVRSSLGGLAHMARVPREDCEQAINLFLSPDPDSRSPENEGRRIARVDGGYLILNYAKYREARNNDERSVYMTEYMREYRRKHKSKGVNVYVNSPLASLAKAEAEAEVHTSDVKEGTGGKEKKPSASAKAPTLPDDLFFSELRRHYPDIDIDRELGKMRAFFLTPKAKSRKMTRRFVVGWLNRCDVPIKSPGSTEKRSMANGYYPRIPEPGEQPISLEEQAELAAEMAKLKAQMNGVERAGYADQTEK